MINLTASSLLAVLLFGCARPAPVRSPVPAGLTPPAVKFKPRAELAEQAKTLTLTLVWTNPGPSTVSYSSNLVTWAPIAHTTNMSLTLTQAPPAYYRVLHDPSVTLAWDPSPDISAIGYHVWYDDGAIGFVDVGEVTRYTLTLKPETTYHFAASCYNLGGLESDLSAWITYTTPAAAPVPARISKQ